MKIKYNIPKLNEFKERIKNIKSKVGKNIESKEKVPMKYYALLVLMLAVGLISFSKSLKRYNDMNVENYVKYELNEDLLVDSNIVDTVQYETAISSISTSISNIIDHDSKKENNDIISTSKKYIYPLDGDIIKDYAMDKLVYSKTLEMWKVHPGIDIAGKIESNVLAVQDGKIIEVKQDSFYGNTIKVEHDDGYVSVYSNLDDLQAVDKGMTVKQGDIIGKLGASAYGEIADESHLHFEILKEGEWVNPLEMLE